MRIIFCWLCFICFGKQIYCQGILDKGLDTVRTRKPPAHDRCAQAVPLEFGQWRWHESNEFATVGPAIETPKAIPYSCIKTFENDLWYRFSSGNHLFAEITIVHHLCNTPAGMQAILIENLTCHNQQHKYLACSNLESTDTIKLFAALKPQTSYLLYLDGFDGTICDFSIYLNSPLHPNVTPADLQYLKYDFQDNPTAGWQPNYQTEFLNNYTQFLIQDNEIQDIAYYLLEVTTDTMLGFWEITAAHIPQEITAEKKRFFNLIPGKAGSAPGVRYCFRIVRISKNYEKQISPIICPETQPPIEDFHLGIPKFNPQTKQYDYLYIIRKKQDYTISLEDETGKVMKQVLLKKEPTGHANGSVNISQYPPGNYYLKMYHEPKRYFKYLLTE
ncbi:MAG: T9SS type A sorting domain-containing protein [Bacteroidia bacterium]|nr:T9SS type A sorting domain-containing protein [Bacteroidia bacterium]